MPVKSFDYLDDFDFKTDHLLVKGYERYSHMYYDPEAIRGYKNLPSTWTKLFEENSSAAPMQHTASITDLLTSVQARPNADILPALTLKTSDHAHAIQTNDARSHP